MLPTCFNHLVLLLEHRVGCSNLGEVSLLSYLVQYVLEQEERYEYFCLTLQRKCLLI